MGESSTAWLNAMCEAFNLLIGAMEVSAEVWSTSGTLCPGGWDVVDGGPARADLRVGL